MEIPTSTVIGHGHFVLEYPDHGSVTAVKAILKRPSVFGAVYIIEEDKLSGFLLMDTDDDDEHELISNHLGEYCECKALTLGAAFDILSKPKRKLFKKTGKQMKNMTMALAIETL